MSYHSSVNTQVRQQSTQFDLITGPVPPMLQKYLPFFTLIFLAKLDTLNLILDFKAALFFVNNRKDQEFNTYSLFFSIPKTLKNGERCNRFQLKKTYETKLLKCRAFETCRAEMKQNLNLKSPRFLKNRVIPRDT